MIPAALIAGAERPVELVPCILIPSLWAVEVSARTECARARVCVTPCMRCAPIYAPPGDDLEAAVKRGAAVFEQCAQKVRTEAIFSSNETIDDVETTSMRCEERGARVCVCGEHWVHSAVVRVCVCVWVWVWVHSYLLIDYYIAKMVPKAPSAGGACVCTSVFAC